MLTKKQLNQRKGKIGASELGTVFSLFATRKGGTPFQYVLRKCEHLLPPEFLAQHKVEWQNNETALLRGSMMENSIMRLFKKMHPDWTIRRTKDNRTYSHPQHEWLVATPDGIIEDENGDLWIAEYKSMSIHRFRNLAETLTDIDDDYNIIKKTVTVTLPISIQLQGAATATTIQANIDASEETLERYWGKKIKGVVFLYVLIGNGEVYYDDPIEIKWVLDQAFVDITIKEASEFYHKYMDEPNEEAILSLRCATDYQYADIAHKDNKIIGETMPFDGNEYNVRQILSQLKSKKEAVKGFEQEIAAYETMLKEWIGDSEGIEDEHSTIATWKRQKGAWTIPSDVAKAVLAQHPEYEGKIRQSEFRRLTVK